MTVMVGVVVMSVMIVDNYVEDSDDDNGINNIDFKMFLQFAFDSVIEKYDMKE